MTDDEDRVTVTDGRDGTAFITLPSVDCLDTQAYAAEIGLDREYAEQLRDALDGWLFRKDHRAQGCNTSMACVMRNGCRRCQGRRVDHIADHIDPEVTT